MVTTLDLPVATSVQDAVNESWTELTRLREASPSAFWRHLQSRGLAVPDSLEALVSAQRALGAAAAPAPVADAWAAAELLGDAVDFSDEGKAPAFAPRTQVEDGAVASIEFGEVVSHVVVLDASSGHVAVHEVAGIAETPGMSFPSWSRLTLGPVVHEADVEPARAATVLARYRFALAVRAFATVEATHQLAIAHARTRVQFGHRIGSYQAVQHRTVNCAIEVALARGLVDDAVRLDAAGDATAGLALEMAVQHSLDRASWTQFEAHHTLAASGFFDLYPAPWLFRRVHADLARIAVYPRVEGTVADEIISTGTVMPASNLGETAEALRVELHALFQEGQPQRGSGRQAERNDALIDELKRRGLLTAQWPAEFGGRNASVEERAVLAEEVALRRVGLGAAFGAATLIGNSIIAFGTEQQRAKYLPLIADADLNFYLGYSEPEVGSDLASVQLTAVRDDDGWVLNGTKRWGQAQRADWAWLAARTDPDATPRHAGISVFLFDLRGLEGFRVEEITSLAGETHAFSHYDDVRIPADALIGEVNGGWKIITAALSEERITMAGLAMGSIGQLEVLLEELVARNAVPAEGSAGRQELGRIATRLQGTRVLTTRSLVAQAHGGDRGAAALEAPLAKIAGGEATEEFQRMAVSLLGPGSLLDDGAAGSIGHGLFDYGLRVCLIGTVGGGTGDIQRNIIARALGLPKD